MDATWDALDRAYFNGYALWTYLMTPFLFAMQGFRSEEIAPWKEGTDTWRGLRVTFPTEIASHSREQDFCFGSDFLLRRHDYHVEASGGFAVAQYVFDNVTVQGITFPTRRRAYMKDEKLLPIHEKLMVSIDISNLRLSSSAAGRRASYIRVTYHGEEQQGRSLPKRFRNISVTAYEFRRRTPVLTKTGLIWMDSMESI